jgi:hypothetical protein
VITAWRGWTVGGDGHLYSPGGLVGRSLQAEPWREGRSPDFACPVSVRRATRYPAPYRARLVHRRPARDCTCGLRGLTDVRELLGYSFGRHQTAGETPRWSDQCDILGQVELSGVILGPWRYDHDPPSTLRAERAVVGRHLYLARPLRRMTPLLAFRYPASTVHEVEHLADVPDLVDPQ